MGCPDVPFALASPEPRGCEVAAGLPLGVSNVLQTVRGEVTNFNCTKFLLTVSYFPFLLRNEHGHQKQGAPG